MNIPPKSTSYLHTVQASINNVNTLRFIIRNKFLKIFSLLLTKIMIKGQKHNHHYSYPCFLVDGNIANCFSSFRISRTVICIIKMAHMWKSNFSLKTHFQSKIKVVYNP